MAYPFTDTKRKRVFPQRQTSYAVGQDHTGKVWIGQRENENQLWCYADGTFQSVEVDLDGALRSIQRDREGRMWLCTSEGVLYQDGDGFSRLPLPMACPIPQSKPYARIASISSGLPPGAAACSTMHIVSVFRSR